MKSDLCLMVFTDLDGTLIDHDTYRWDAAQDALFALKQQSAGVVLASSKTAAEVSALRQQLGLEQWPAIVENGAGALPPYVSDVPDASQYTAVRAILNNLPDAFHGLFRGFGDATIEQVAQMTGLTRQDAALAKKRAFSEPGQWIGTEAQQVVFQDYLLTKGVTAQQGGRFLTLSFGRNKVDQMRSIIDRYQPKHTIALGDAPNDMQMLEYADFGVIIANPHRAPLAQLQGETENRIIRTKAAGPSGWNKAIIELLDRLELH